MCAVGDCLSVWYLRISLTQNMSECKEGDLGKVFLWQSLWLLNHLCKAKSEKEWQSFRCCAPYRWSKPDLWQLLGKQTKTKNCDLQPEILQIPFRIANALVLKRKWQLQCLLLITFWSVLCTVVIFSFTDDDTQRHTLVKWQNSDWCPGLLTLCSSARPVAELSARTMSWHPLLQGRT